METKSSDTPVIDGPSCGLAVEDERGRAYNETGFRFLLSIERLRAERSGRPFFTILVDLEESPGVSAPISSASASALFAGLHTCIRDTDFLGWYRDGRVASAVLTEPRKQSTLDGSHVAIQRITADLAARLPSEVGRRLRVRVFTHPDPEHLESDGVLPEDADLTRRV